MIDQLGDADLDVLCAVYDRDLRYRSINAAACALIGRSAQEVIGHTVEEVFGERRNPDNLTYLMRARDTGKAQQGTLAVGGPSGEVHLDALYLPLMSDGEVTQIVAIAYNITAHLAARQELAESEETLLRAITEHIPTMCALYDADLRFRYVNDAVLRYTSLRSVDFIGKTNEELFPDRELPFLSLLRAARDTGKTQRGEIALADSGEHDRIFSMAFQPLVDPTTSTITQIVAAAQDVTEERRAQEELRRASKLEALGVLAGGLAHDFNNLLTGVLANVTCAQEDQTLSASSREALHDAELACNRARTLAGQLLTFAGGGAPLRQATPLEGLLTETVAFCLRSSSVSAEIDIEPELPLVDGDSEQIEQVVQNLTMNAMEAMPEGGTLKIRARREPDNNSAAKPSVEICFDDSGRGVPLEQRERIFDPFYSTREGRSGLGLAICFRIVERHHGRLWVEDAPSGGARFVVRLPIAAATSKSTRKEGASGATLRILVMDDEPLVCRAVRRILARVGHEVVVAAHGEEAIESYSKALDAGQPFDLVLLDLTVPGGLGGEETLARLRQLDASVRAIVSSGYAEDPIIANYRDYGFVGAARKPYSSVTLYDAVAGAMSLDVP